MTHTSTEQPEALRLAEILENKVRGGAHPNHWVFLREGATELRRLHARAQELEAKVENGKRLLREEMERANRYAEASQAQRVPLAMYQRDTIKAKAWRETMVGGYYDPNAIIDATEAAHGITQEKQG